MGASTEGLVIEGNLTNVGDTIVLAVPDVDAAYVSCRGTGNFNVAFELSDNGGLNWYSTASFRADTLVQGGSTTTQTVAATRSYEVLAVGATHIRVRVTVVNTAGTLTLRLAPLFSGQTRLVYAVPFGTVTGQIGQVTTGSSGATTAQAAGSSAIANGTTRDNLGGAARHAMYVVAAGAPTAGVVELQVSPDNVNWYKGPTITVTAVGVFYIDLVAIARYTRAAITTAIVGGTVTVLTYSGT